MIKCNGVGGWWKSSEQIRNRGRKRSFEAELKKSKNGPIRSKTTSPINAESDSVT